MLFFYNCQNEQQNHTHIIRVMVGSMLDLLGLWGLVGYCAMAVAAVGLVIIGWIMVMV